MVYQATGRQNGRTETRTGSVLVRPFRFQDLATFERLILHGVTLVEEVELTGADGGRQGGREGSAEELELDVDVALTWPCAGIWIAECNGIGVGTVRVHLDRDGCATIRRVRVSREWARRGLGRALLGFATAQCAVAGSTRVAVGGDVGYEVARRMIEEMAAALPSGEPVSVEVETVMKGPRWEVLRHAGNGGSK